MSEPCPTIAALIADLRTTADLLRATALDRTGRAEACVRRAAAVLRLQRSAYQKPLDG